MTPPLAWSLPLIDPNSRHRAPHHAADLRGEGMTSSPFDGLYRRDTGTDESNAPTPNRQVVPARAPASTSDWRTHLRTVSAVPTPSSSATRPIAAHFRIVLARDLRDHPHRPLLQLQRVPLR
jgi:hypothetical protein